MASIKKKPYNKKLQDAARADESRKILEQVALESETVASSSMARASERAGKNLSGLNNKDTDDDNDPIVILGKRIGRTLGWIAVIFLTIHLVSTYIL